MSVVWEQRTRQSLLARLRTGGERGDWDQAWEEFFRQYAPLIRAWCRRHGLSDGDAEEVTSMVLFKLGQRMGHLDYDPSARFRAWLRMVVLSQVREYWEQRARKPANYGSGGGTSDDVLARLPGPQGPAEDLYQEIEAQRQLLARALDEVRRRVAPSTWQAFVATAVEGTDASEVAARLGLTRVAVYKAKSRTLDLLRQEVDRLKAREADECGGQRDRVSS